MIARLSKIAAAFARSPIRRWRARRPARLRLGRTRPCLRANGGGRRRTAEPSLQLLLVMGLLTILPALLLMMTSFTRIIVVLAILRQAWGLRQSPPNQVLIGISLFLSLLSWRPRWRVNETARALFGRRDRRRGRDRTGGRPVPRLHDPPDARIRPRDVRRYCRSRTFASPQDVPFSILLPAFVTSELKTAFQIGHAVLAFWSSTSSSPAC